MAKAKALLMAALAVMTIGMAASADAAKPQNTSYDPYVCVEEVKNWRVSNYSPDVHVEKVTAKEARFGGYDSNNVPGTNITEAKLEEMLAGNGNDVGE